MSKLTDIFKRKEKIVEVEKIVEKIIEKRIEVPVEKIVTVEKIVEVAPRPRVNYHLLANSMVLNFDGQTITLSKADGRFHDVLTAIKENRLNDIPEIIDVTKRLAKANFIEDKEMPKQLLEKISLHKENGWPIEIFSKFWENLKQNPSLRSREQLYNFLQHNGHPLTVDGCFIAYRGVRSDFKDIHTGKFDNSPGSVCSMERSMVNENPNETCSSGLHVACYEYAKDFGKSGRILEVKINPKDVVAVPNDYNGTKMRVCRFEVIRECSEMRTETVYEHDSSAVETYLVRIKGKKKWGKIDAANFKEAADQFAKGQKWFKRGLKNTVLVRKGSNRIERFEF